MNLSGLDETGLGDVEVRRFRLCRGEERSAGGGALARERKEGKGLNI